MEFSKSCQFFNILRDIFKIYFDVVNYKVIHNKLFQGCSITTPIPQHVIFPPPMFPGSLSLPICPLGWHIKPVFQRSELAQQLVENLNCTQLMISDTSYVPWGRPGMIPEFTVRNEPRKPASLAPKIISCSLLLHMINVIIRKGILESSLLKLSFINAVT